MDSLWYRHHPASLALLPLSWVFGGVVRLRKSLYAHGWLSSTTLPVPVIIVGNITVGGTGKTPLVLTLTERLKQLGRRPGIITRGYAGRSRAWPQVVTKTSDPALVGDEAVLLASRAAVPVVAAPSRTAAGLMLLEQHACDVIVGDDGLQHLALARDVEIIVVDAERGLGNGRLLPAGPLREPASRLNSGALVLRSSRGDEYREGEPGFRLLPSAFVTLGGERRSLGVYRGVEADAVAGIGYPKRFFDTLRALGVRVHEHVQPDHYAYADADMVAFGDRPLLMTEKDAVKCARLRYPAQAAFLEVSAVLNEAAEQAVTRLLEGLA